MAKTTITTIINNGAGTLYCAGFVNGKYIQILGSSKLTMKELKTRLVNRYNEKYNLEEMSYGN